MLSRYEVEAVRCTRLFFSCRITWDRISKLRADARLCYRFLSSTSLAGLAEIGICLPGVRALVLAGGRFERRDRASGRLQVRIFEKQSE